MKRLRREHGLTQGQLAEKLYTTKSMICRHERGELPLKSDRIELLTRLFNRPADEVLGLHAATTETSSIETASRPGSVIALFEEQIRFLREQLSAKDEFICLLIGDGNAPRRNGKRAKARPRRGGAR